MGQDAQIFVSIRGFDTVYQQTISEQYVYSAQDILVDHVFVDMIEQNGDDYVLDLSKIHQTKPQVIPPAV